MGKNKTRTGSFIQPFIQLKKTQVTAAASGKMGYSNERSKTQTQDRVCL